jgi:hypothetical protein
MVIQMSFTAISSSSIGYGYGTVEVENCLWCKTLLYLGGAQKKY